MPRHKADRGGDRPGPVFGQNWPPIWHGDGTVTLWHDDSPGVRVRIKADWFRRTFKRKSEFATSRELRNYYKTNGIKLKKRRF